MAAEEANEGRRYNVVLTRRNSRGKRTGDERHRVRFRPVDQRLNILCGQENNMAALSLGDPQQLLDFLKARFFDPTHQPATFIRS